MLLIRVVLWYVLLFLYAGFAIVRVPCSCYCRWCCSLFVLLFFALVIVIVHVRCYSSCHLLVFAFLLLLSLLLCVLASVIVRVCVPGPC